MKAQNNYECVSLAGKQTPLSWPGCSAHQSPGWVTSTRTSVFTHLRVSGCESVLVSTQREAGRPSASSHDGWPLICLGKRAAARDHSSRKFLVHAWSHGHICISWLSSSCMKSAVKWAALQWRPLCMDHWRPSTEVFKPLSASNLRNDSHKPWGEADPGMTWAAHAGRWWLISLQHSYQSKLTEQESIDCLFWFSFQAKSMFVGVEGVSICLSHIGVDLI